MQPIAHIETPFVDKFGVPRQTGLADAPGRIVFDPPYRVEEAVRGLEEFEYIWLLWAFHLSGREGWSPTVRPPRLGGNKRVGVFATRSPFRPNNIGLSSVKLMGITYESGLGPVLHVAGADMVSGTPILDIKPYIAYADSHPDARCGFAQSAPEENLVVDPSDPLLQRLPTELRSPLVAALQQDPRPHYHDQPERIYAMRYGRWEVRFRVEGAQLLLVSLEPVA